MNPQVQLEGYPAGETQTSVRLAGWDPFAADRAALLDRLYAEFVRVMPPGDALLGLEYAWVSEPEYRLLALEPPDGLPGHRRRARCPCGWTGWTNGGYARAHALRCPQASVLVRRAA